MTDGRRKRRGKLNFRMLNRLRNAYRDYETLETGACR